MKNDFIHNLKSTFRSTGFWIFFGFIFIIIVLFFMFPELFNSAISYPLKESNVGEKNNNVTDPSLQYDVSNLAPLDTMAYDQKINELANNPPPKGPTTKIIKDPKTGEKTTVTIEPKPVINLWPVKTVYPNAGAILPFKRIVAYYGNLYSKQMGVLGKYPTDQMLEMLQAEVQKWTDADPTTPAIPALHYIAVVAQSSAGTDSKYRFRMPDSEIDKVLVLAAKIDALVFLDIQVGLSDLQTEVPLLEKYLKLPNVHLGVDPEFSMKNGGKPGRVVGTFDAGDINFTANYLAKIVKENNLPPKVFIVHRYTEEMVTNSKDIKPLPEVEIVMNMDGWGTQAKKIGTYKNFIYPEPVQFTGFKLFYKEDVLTPGTTLFMPEDLLKLNPRPIYIQYQ